MNRANNAIALVDMDGTLADYSGAMKRDLERLRSPYEPPLEGPIELLEAQLHLVERMRLIKLQPGWWSGLPMIRRGFQVVNVLRDMGFSIHVATKGPHRNSAAWMEKVEWCREKLPYASVHITEEKSLLYGKVLVDDWPPYVEEWLRWRPRGLAVVPAYEYNAHLADNPQVFMHDGTDDAVDSTRLLQERLDAFIAGWRASYD